MNINEDCQTNNRIDCLSSFTFFYPLMAQLIEDCLRIIFVELQEDSASLYSCILVNRFWCRIGIPILWKNVLAYKNISYKKLYDVITYMLSPPSKQLLSDNNIVLSLSTLSNKPLFNYISFFSKIYHTFIKNMLETLIIMY